MAFTASVTEFGHTFAEAVVEVTEANLEYRLNDYGCQYNYQYRVCF